MIKIKFAETNNKKEDKMTVGEFIVQKLSDWNNHKSDASHIECSDFELLLKKIKEHYTEDMDSI